MVASAAGVYYLTRLQLGSFSGTTIGTPASSKGDPSGRGRFPQMKSILSLVVALGLGFGFSEANAIEEPQFTVVSQQQGFEIREYAPYIVAEVVVPGPADQAGNAGFRLLAGYIFGQNKGERKIAMTAPVTQTPTPVKMAMTAPVTQEATASGFLIQFKMPGEYTLATLPEPLDPKIKLKEMPGGRFAVIRYSGGWSQANYSEHLEQLQRGVQAAGLATTGEPIYSRYDPPYMPWFLRRNEIWLRLD